MAMVYLARVCLAEPALQGGTTGARATSTMSDID
jgi:hypothetical protein